MATLKDVAKKAGVSIATASYALNNRPILREETKEQVLKVARELNYRVNGHARDLQRGQTKLIALILSNLTGPFFSELIRGVEDESFEHGYNLIVSTTYKGQLSSSFRILEENRADGYLVFSQFIDEGLLQRVGAGSPIVLLDHPSREEFVSSVTVDNYGGARAATRYLLEAGHRSILFLSGSRDSFHNSSRLRGFQDEMKIHGLPCDDILYGEFSEERAHQVMGERFAGGAIPDAIFSANDQMALGIYEAAADSGLSIPHAISVVGFDDASFSRYLNPSLSTVQQPSYHQGRVAAQNLFLRLENPQNKVGRVQLSTELIVRKSVQVR